MIARITPAPGVHFAPLPGRLRLAFLAILAVVALATAVRYFAKAEKPSALGTQTRTAFLRWRPQVLALDEGTNIYVKHAYPNPPVMALVLYPLMKLPPLVGAMAWFALKVGMAVGIAAFAFRLIGPTIPDWAKAAAILLGLHPMLGDLSHGNVNLFVAFVLFAAIDLFRRRCDFSAGVVLALAIACKVTPALFLPYFAYKRAWRLLAGSIVGLMLWLAVVPGAVLGWDFNRELLTSWFDVMVKPFVIDGKVTSEHPNQSVPGLTFRLLTAEPSFVDYDADDRQVATGFHNVADIGPWWAKKLVQACMGVFALTVVVACRWPTWRPGVTRTGLVVAAELAFVSIGMLLFSERTWKHHAVGLVLPFGVLLACGHRWAYALVAVVGGLMVVPSLLVSAAQDVAMTYGTYTAAFALLACGTALISFSCDAESSERSAG